MLADQTCSEVQHPLLDRVRECSANPEHAAPCFGQILHPVPYIRKDAIHHAWCADVVSTMLGETHTSYAETGVLGRAKHRRIAGWYAAMLGCLTCTGSREVNGDKGSAHLCRVCGMKRHRNS